MSLFPSDIDSNNNLLPKDGTVNYYGKILTSAEANRFYASLLSTIEWQHDEIILYGKRIVTK
ncbi:MAG: alpha-ketoglutarate-dependent dioxygenase AlkB, partial [Breznakibacter sp.]|nr:alpha-ketoglutarate-dependent dioxygenase AlkB [Breznakibacter sp.]